MSPDFMQQVDRRISGALGSGALQPMDADAVTLDDDGLAFVVRWPSANALQSTTPPPPPGGPRDPDFNPFLPPDPESRSEQVVRNCHNKIRCSSCRLGLLMESYGFHTE